MAKPPAKEIELEPDAWARFERAVDVVSKSPPQHRKKRDASPKELKEIADLIENGNPADMHRIAKKLGNTD